MTLNPSLKIVFAVPQSFRKYMTFKKDYNELLLYILRELVKNALHFEEIVTGSTSGITYVDVKVDDLSNKVKNILSLEFVTNGDDINELTKVSLTWCRLKSMTYMI